MADFQIAAPPSGTLVSSITTDQSAYQVGQTVTMTFTETNQGTQPIFVPTGPNGFDFQSGGSIAGPVDSTEPQGPVEWTTLQPGQSWTQTTTWPIGASVSVPTTETISNIYDPNGDTATFEVLSTSSSGNTSTSGTGDDGSSTTGQGMSGGGGSSSTAPVASLINSTVTANHADFKAGEAVRITLKIHGEKATTATSPQVPSREVVTILDGSRLISRMTRRVPFVKLKHLDAGRSITLTTVWDGRPNQPGAHQLSPGVYTIEVGYAGYRGSTAIDIGRNGS